MSAINNERIQNFYDEMQNAATNYVLAYNEHNRTKKELKAMKKLATEKVDSYNQELAKETYKSWAAEGNPVEIAIRTRFVPGCLRASFKTNDDDVMTLKFDHIEFLANLPMMMATLGAGVFADPDWFKKVEKLTWLIAARINKKLCDSAAFVYKIEDASKEFEFPEGVNPLTDDGVVHALQEIFDSILFVPDEDGQNKIHTTMKTDTDGSVYSPEWECIRESMTKAGYINEVLICNTGKMTEFIANAMYGIYTEKCPITLSLG